MAFDPAAIERRVANAVAEAGATPWLVGYDANGIQELITASGRPISMRGASEAILGFDEAIRGFEGAAGDDKLSIFAGGGRGVVLARSGEEADRRARELVDRYRAATRGGVMATCAVPLERGVDAEGRSIRWLRHRLEIAKDEALPPGGRLPEDKAHECVYCHRYLGENERTRDGRTEMLCTQCGTMLDRGHDAGRERGDRFGEMSNSIANMACEGWIAAISADGNNLGGMFELLGSLVELAVVSEAIADIFQTAQDQALHEIDERFRLPLLTGGDDVRAFIPPDNVLGYVDALAAGVETGAASHAGAARDAGVILPATAKALGDVGIGIGAVIASVYYPARRLIAHAHVLERSAKAACRVRGWRSGFDFAIITNEDAMIEKPVRTGAGIGPRPLAPRTPDWATALDRARALAKIPRAQIAALAATVGFVDECDPSGPPAAQPASDESELANLLRYQVARSSAWQAWYEACGIDWRDRNDVVVHRPTRDMLELARLLAFGGP
jgi:hypothetical protein